MNLARREPRWAVFFTMLIALILQVLPLPDWLSVSPYADRIVALRPAHISHGGGGAVYVILRRPREE